MVDFYACEYENSTDRVLNKAHKDNITITYFLQLCQTIALSINNISFHYIVRQVSKDPGSLGKMPFVLYSLGLPTETALIL